MGDDSFMLFSWPGLLPVNNFSLSLLPLQGNTDAVTIKMGFKWSGIAAGAGAANGCNRLWTLAGDQRADRCDYNTRPWLDNRRIRFV